ncbi:hypothetical protein A3Q34_08485 [Colwellia sp. PAMC 20917]|uniref:pyocin activator PrtN family protein n=1 Tax=Colwellia sp. PAMC 20917 TaxID=1816218 RepID=UPI0008783F8E|nr:pyocin activator PrtN family protein [Colwellia sp. PAMC 20917]AOW76887.1 hypothetical protein A3Q34_08485 [Colwellia sp. PAMC 20917]
MKLSETFELLMLEHDGQFHIPLNYVATRYFKMESAAFKKHLNSGALPKDFTNSVELNVVPTRSLANLFEYLKKEKEQIIMCNRTKNSQKSNDMTNDLNPMGRWMLMSSLMQQYGTAIIPYTRIAADYLNWKSEKTAMAKYNDGTVTKLQLVTIQSNVGRKQPVFVAVQDLADFLLSNRNVAILN